MFANKHKIYSLRERHFLDFSQPSLAALCDVIPEETTTRIHKHHPLSSVINSHHWSHHLYADDIKMMYLSLRTPNSNYSLQQFDDIFQWMNE